MRASCAYGLHGDQGGGYCIGADGDDFEALVRELGTRYQDRLAWVVDDQTGERREFSNTGNTQGKT